MTREDMIEAMARGMALRDWPDDCTLSDAATFEAVQERLDDAQAALSALEAMGCVVVPREPTHEMIEAHNILVGEARLKQTLCPRAAYTAMIAAASPLPAQGRG